MTSCTRRAAGLRRSCLPGFEPARTGSRRHPARNARPGLRPGACKGKAHRREYLGYAGRRVLVSAASGGKTLADRPGRWRTGDRDAGVPAIDPARDTWQPVKPGDDDDMSNGQRLCTSSGPAAMAHSTSGGQAQSRNASG